MVHDGEAQMYIDSSRCLGQGMPPIGVSRFLGPTSLRGHGSRLEDPRSGSGEPGASQAFNFTKNESSREDAFDVNVSQCS